MLSTHSPADNTAFEPADLAELDGEAECARPSGPLRKCVASGEVLDKAQLQRFVLSPDGVVTPDLFGKLPGRGIWVQPTRALIERAAKKGGFAKSAKQKVTVPTDLCERLAQHYLDQCGRLLGLARRSGNLVLGADPIKAALQKNDLSALIVAEDTSRATADDYHRMASSGKGPKITCIEAFSQRFLAENLGRATVAALGLAKLGPLAQTSTDINLGAGWDGLATCIQRYQSLREGPGGDH